MTPQERAQTRQIWRDARGALPVPPEPDAMSLAAYAERRAGRAETAAVEAWLAHNPERWDDVRAARAVVARPAVTRSVRGALAGLTTAITLAIAVIAFKAGSDGLFFPTDSGLSDFNLTGEVDDFAL